MRKLYGPSLPVPQMYAPPVTSSVCSEHSKLLAMQCSFPRKRGRLPSLTILERTGLIKLEHDAVNPLKTVKVLSHSAHLA